MTSRTIEKATLADGVVVEAGDWVVLLWHGRGNIEVPAGKEDPEDYERSGDTMSGWRFWHFEVEKVVENRNDDGFTWIELQENQADTYSPASCYSSMPIAVAEAMNRTMDEQRRLFGVYQRHVQR